MTLVKHPVMGGYDTLFTDFTHTFFFGAHQHLLDIGRPPATSSRRPDQLQLQLPSSIVVRLCEYLRGRPRTWSSTNTRGSRQASTTKTHHQNTPLSDVKICQEVTEAATEAPNTKHAKAGMAPFTTWQGIIIFLPSKHPMSSPFLPYGSGSKPCTPGCSSL